ncbi:MULTISPECIES: acetoacetyl-CoA reductase [Janthinobacterium]|uniref:acetoacetyl-CoA reductase n=1 Tax=Janthinobacterium TaxID=29580 RepID=UPI0008879DF2|nr:MULTISPECIES: acetoacetyl-CoA reductase [Janthinobacterium]MBR7631949.1 acetoacetyl-CoA reductase [Janthinobacterium lividum]SDH91679.1 3-oxoacyl-[acyl-carrier-protein] reductase [Janthinobacterium sp. YR213]
MNEQKVALVTGGMGGLGTALCRRLHAAGFAVVAAHTPGNARVESWLGEQHGQGYYFHPLALDVGDFDACSDAVASVLAQFGRVDVLVNNAGITRDQSMRKMELPHWAEVMRTNLDSLFNMSKQVLEPMLANRWGRIINISSVNGQKGAFGQCNYAAAKAGVHGFSKALALEVARHGITVNTVSPGYLRTQMVTAVPAEILETKILPQIPLGRLGEPDEVAALVAYLASDEAAFVTGANIAINGGQHMS